MNKFLTALVPLVLPVVLFTSYAQTADAASYDANLKVLANLQAQLRVLQSQLEKSQSTTAEEEWKFNYSKTKLKLGLEKEDETYDEDDQVKRYLVQNSRLYENGKWTKNTDTDEYKIWNIFAEIAGDNFVDDYMTRYATYRNMDTSVLGFVELLDERASFWGLAVNANASDFSNAKWTRDLVGVLIHEYTHVLTLNASQVTHKKKKEGSCNGTYLSLKGCSKKHSYINAFVTEFWDEEDLNHKMTNSSYYKEHKEDFVTKYAVKNPEEDIAESFTQFILYEKPTGSKEEDLKVAFFYEYPELVKMRTRIREAVKEYYVKVE
jgi:hypothetical protein